MVRRLSQILINGTNVTSVCIDWTIQTACSDYITNATLNFPQVIMSLVTLSNKATLEIYEGFVTSTDTKIFDGYIETYKPDGFKITVYGKDKLSELVRKEITRVYDKTNSGDSVAYPLGKLSDIAKDIITTYGLLNADGTTIQDSGTVLTVNQFVCNHADPFERLQKIAQTLGWVLYYRADTNYVYMEPRNFTTNANVLTVGVNIVELPTWNYDKSQMINDLTLEGAVLDQPRTEVFNGNGSNKSFQLSSTEAPSYMNVYYNAGKNFNTTAYANADLMVGVPVGTTTGTYDFTFDLKNKTFLFSAITPASATGDLLCEYFIQTPNPIHRKNSTSIGDYGQYKKTITLSDVLNVSDAEIRSQIILNNYSKPFVSGTVKVLVTDSTFRVGQGVQVIDNISATPVNEILTIRTITKKWPGNFDTMELGDAEWLDADAQVNMLERIKRLEETLVGDTAIVSEIVDNNLTIPLVPISQSIQVDLINDTFLLGMAINGTLYADSETAILDDFEVTTGWAGVNCTLAVNSTAGQFVVGTGGVKATFANATTATMTKSITLTDISGSTGVSSGTPTHGTVGLWLYATTGSKITSVTLKLGSSLSNYMLMNGKTYAQYNSLTGSFSLQDGLNYLVFDLPTGTKTGTPVWTANNYAVITIITNAATDATFDYLTVSLNDDIGLNGLGDRTTNWTTTVY